MFKHLTPISIDYATLPISQGFNWENCFEADQIGEWYLVVFRSILKSNYDEIRLNNIDKQASIDAMASPGFIHYFCGSPASNGKCLSLCIWKSQQDARNGIQSSSHREAITMVKQSYDYYEIELYQVIKKLGIKTPDFVLYH